MAIFPALLALLLVASSPRPALTLERCHATSVEGGARAAPLPARAAAR
jgi:hypothetical protein